MDTALLKIHANKLAQENKSYFSKNGDEYQGRSGRLVFIRSGKGGSNSIKNNTNSGGGTTIINNYPTTTIIEPGTGSFDIDDNLGVFTFDDNP